LAAAKPGADLLCVCAAFPASVLIGASLGLPDGGSGAARWLQRIQSGGPTGDCVSAAIVGTTSKPPLTITPAHLRRSPRCCLTAFSTQPWWCPCPPRADSPGRDRRCGTAAPCDVPGCAIRVDKYRVQSVQLLRPATVSLRRWRACRPAAGVTEPRPGPGAAAVPRRSATAQRHPQAMQPPGQPMRAGWLPPAWSP
jgi:hypothetical protein